MQRYVPPKPPAPIDKNQLRETLAAHPVFNDLMRFLEEQLEQHRTFYEAQPASELLRGKIMGVRGVISLLSPT